VQVAIAVLGSLPGQVEWPARVGGCSVRNRVDPVPIGVHTEGATANRFLDADHAAHLVAGLRGAIEDLPRMSVRSKRLSLHDADAREHPEPIGIGETGRLAVDQALELVE